MAALLFSYLSKGTAARKAGPLKFVGFDSLVVGGSHPGVSGVRKGPAVFLGKAKKHLRFFQ